MFQASVGELIVGAYLRIEEGCQVVSYNQRSPDAGNQTEVDVVAIKTRSGRQTVYGCEVVTHLDGPNYSTRKDTSEWSDFHSSAPSLRRLWDKFENAHRLLDDVFDEADAIDLQFWSPVVREGNMTEGLAELQRRFEASYDAEIELVYNAEYADRIGALRKRAAAEEKRYEEPAFRFLQILAHLRE